MGEWYPIVHGRTAFVDFRSNLIVVPEFLGDRALEWAKRHILSTTRLPERLPGNPRWSVFQAPDMVVVGVTCMAGEVSREMTHEIEVVDGRERARRPLYVFLGYAAARPVSGLPPRDLALFAPLYRFVAARWREESRDARRKHLSVVPDPLPELPPGAFLDLDDRDEMVVIHPHSRADQLWASALEHSRASLCIGLPRVTDAVAGVFHNVTIQDQELSESRRREPPRPQPERQREVQPRSGREPQPLRRSKARAQYREGGEAPDDFGETHRPRRDPPSWGCDVIQDVFSGIFSLFDSLAELAFGTDRHDAQDRYRAPLNPYEDDPHDGRGVRRESARPADAEPHRPPRRHPDDHETARAPGRDGHPSAPPEAPRDHTRQSAPAGFVRSRPEAPKPQGSTWGGWDEGSSAPASTPLKFGVESGHPEPAPSQHGPRPSGPTEPAPDHETEPGGDKNRVE